MPVTLARRANVYSWWKPIHNFIVDLLALIHKSQTRLIYLLMNIPRSNTNCWTTALAKYGGQLRQMNVVCSSLDANPEVIHLVRGFRDNNNIYYELAYYVFWFSKIVNRRNEMLKFVE